MRVNKKYLGIILVFVLVISLFTGCGNEVEQKDASQGDGIAREEYQLTIATGPKSGLYYPIGTAFGEVFTNMGYKVDILETAGSVENIQMLKDGNADLAIVMSDAIDLDEKNNFSELMALYPNMVQVIAGKDSGITKFEDIKGKKIAVGAENSGVEKNAKAIFETYNMTYADVEIYHLNYAEAYEGIKSGAIDAAFVTSGVPNEAIVELNGATPITVVPIEKEGKFLKSVISAGIYGNEDEVATVSIMNLMLVNSQLPDDVVQDMLSGIFENIDKIQSINEVAKQAINKENAKMEMPISFHPGAKSYFAEN